MTKLTKLLLVVLFCSLCVWGCNDDDDDDNGYNPNIDPSEFGDTIDNQYLPMTPGTTFIYESDNGVERIEIYITHDTKDVMGVTCTVVRERNWIDGELEEDTLDWFAQHENGDVWYFGEDSKEIENGRVVSTEGSWEAGVDGAKPGIIMLGDPQVGDSYRQEYYEGEAEDMAEVLALDATVGVPYGRFENCLQTREWSPLEPGVSENKYYAPGVGLLLERVVEGGSGQVKLIDITTE